MKKRKKEDLTVENLREITGTNYSDEEAEKIVSSVKQFVAILYEFMREQDAKAVKEKKTK